MCRGYSSHHSFLHAVSIDLRSTTCPDGSRGTEVANLESVRLLLPAGADTIRIQILIHGKSRPLKTMSDPRLLEYF